MAEAKKSKRRWLEVDAGGQVLGRLACGLAKLLLGKDQVTAKRNVVEEISIVVTNTDKVALTGAKEEQKLYRHYSGYPGGLKERNVAEQRKKDSTVIVRNAVAGMLPKNKLRDKRLANLKLFKGDEHPYKQMISK